jgi:hypothetical protein
MKWHKKPVEGTKESLFVYLDVRLELGEGGVKVSRCQGIHPA